jgi:hypothetical protein
VRGIEALRRVTDEHVDGATDVRDDGATDERAREGVGGGGIELSIWKLFIEGSDLMLGDGDGGGMLPLLNESCEPQGCESPMPNTCS